MTAACSAASAFTQPIVYFCISSLLPLSRTTLCARACALWRTNALMISSSFSTRVTETRDCGTALSSGV